MDSSKSLQILFPRWYSVAELKALEERNKINTVNLRYNMQKPLALKFVMRATVNNKHITSGELPY